MKLKLFSYKNNKMPEKPTTAVNTNASIGIGINENKVATVSSENNTLVSEKISSDNNDTKSSVKTLGKKSATFKRVSSLKWPLQIAVLTLALTLFFSIISESVLSGTGVTMAIFIIIFFMLINIVFDMVGVSLAACLEEPLLAMAAKKIIGAKEAISLVKNADKVQSIFSDVIGDVCGILSGAAGAALTLRIILSLGDNASIIIATLVSGLVAALTVFGKAICKGFAFENAESIMLFTGKVICFFKSIFNKIFRKGK